MDKIPHTKFSTDLLPEEYRYEAWQESMGVLFDIETEESPENFEAHVEAFMYDQLVVGLTASRAAHYIRSRSKLNGDGLDMIMVQLFLQGEMQFGVDQSITHVKKGDMVVFDLGQKAQNFDTDYKLLAIIFPRDVISEYVPDVELWHGKVLPRDQPMTQLLRNHMLALYRYAPEVTADHGASMQRSTLELAASAFRASADNLARSSSIVEATILQEIKIHIRANLAQSALSVESIAATFGLSRSQLYRISEPLGGLMNYIRKLRLNRCLRELKDPAFAHVSISEVGFKWGFNDIRTFNRNFKHAFGITPKDSRELGSRKNHQEASIENPMNQEVDRNYELWLRSQA